MSALRIASARASGPNLSGVPSARSASMAIVLSRIVP
jgi:hypothetical protein